MENNTVLTGGIIIVALIAGAVYFYAVSNPVFVPEPGIATTTPSG